MVPTPLQSSETFANPFERLNMYVIDVSGWSAVVWFFALSGILAWALLLGVIFTVWLDSRI
ncbi:hypothetical protein UFOVP148_3 [uncultured Caudovirales phage]|uniref:Uncharacterized protein n=1 Tax=uncultured Caudovirales phage TaxID=2100421 RepID=A0A6J7W870_9CAUD|nr:hypothetical protein UFOVP148_3 [uncultured Caudovirales phage]